MKRAALAVALALAGCNANDVLLYGAAGAANASAGNALGAGDTNDDDTPNGSGGNAASANLGSTGASGGTTETGGTSASGGTTETGGTSEVSGAGGTDAPSPCASNDDCYSTWYCSKTSCDDAEGVCLPSPVLCDATPEPVCGCDDVTYWNTCVRASFGVTADRPHECGADGARPPCSSDEECGAAGLICAHLLRPGDVSCDPRGGTCWGIPLDCSGGNTDSRRWLPCEPSAPDMSAPDCLSTCDAIESGGVYVPAPRGFPCQ